VPKQNGKKGCFIRLLAQAYFVPSHMLEYRTVVLDGRIIYMMQKVYKSYGGAKPRPQSQSQYQYQNQNQEMMKKNGCGCGKKKKWQ
jgi:hypothetical protein